MIAYEFYRRDEKGENHFIWILPERRNDRERITKESIINFGRTTLGNSADVNNIVFFRARLDESTGEIFWPGPLIRTYKEV
jgi:hypothetical protein